MNENESFKYILFFILILILFFLVFTLISNNKFDESIPPPSNYKPFYSSVKEGTIKKPKPKKMVNMLNLYESRNYGYPNLKGAYVLCYINSSLQLLRTLFSSIKFKLQPEINNFIQFIKPQGRITEIEKILKLLVPNEKDRNNLFYNQIKENNNVLRLKQSDSYDFLEKMLNFCIQKDKSLLNFISFSIKDINNNEKIVLDNSILTIGNLKKLYKEEITENKISFNRIINDAMFQPYFSTDLFLDNFSDYLIIHLDMMDENYSKVLIKIIIEDKVQFKTIFNKIYRFNLLSVICHIGNSFSRGHYVNYSKRPINKEGTEYGWFLYDDIKVNKIDDLNKNIISNGYQPYIFLLKKV